MGWKHVQGSGAQASSGSNHTLTATFSGAVAAGDLIVVSGVWCPGVSGTPTMADNVNGVNYTYKGPTVVSGTAESRDMGVRDAERCVARYIYYHIYHR